MGDYISLSQGILVAVVSMVAVFLVLILIAFLISGLKAFSGDRKEKVTTKEVVKATEPLIVGEDPDMITEELVAVISAAIATSLGVNIPDINIKSIRRVPQMTSTWSNVGNLRKPIERL